MLLVYILIKIGLFNNFQVCCWNLIECQTIECFSSPDFEDSLYKSTLMTIVDGSFDFFIKEADLFAAVQRWAVKECERKEMETNGGNLRQVRLSFSSLLFLFIAYISTSLHNKNILYGKFDFRF